jgi:hypothetical protein
MDSRIVCKSVSIIVIISCESSCKYSSICDSVLKYIHPFMVSIVDTFSAQLFSILDVSCNAVSPILTCNVPLSTVEDSFGCLTFAIYIPAHKYRVRAVRGSNREPILTAEDNWRHCVYAPVEIHAFFMWYSLRFSRHLNSPFRIHLKMTVKLSISLHRHHSIYLVLLSNNLIITNHGVQFTLTGPDFLRG